MHETEPGALDICLLQERRQARSLITGGRRYSSVCREGECSAESSYCNTHILTMCIAIVVSGVNIVVIHYVFGTRSIPPQHLHACRHAHSHTSSLGTHGCFLLLCSYLPGQRHILPRSILHLAPVWSLPACMDQMAACTLA